MEFKKHPWVSLENKRNRFFQIGLVIALATTLAAFEWTTYEETEQYAELGMETNFIDEELLPTVKIDRPVPVIKPKPRTNTTSRRIVDEIIEVSDDTPVEDPIDDDLLDLSDLDDMMTSDADSADIALEPVDFAVIEMVPHFSSWDPDAEKDVLRTCVEQEMFRQLYKEVKIPGIVKAMGSGRYTAYVQFIIETDGSVSDVMVANEERLHPAITKEATRAVKAGKGWIPGSQRGKKVPVRMMIPITMTVQ